MTKQLIFEPITSHKPGTIEQLLAKSFDGMAANATERENCRRKWHKVDQETFENPETIGRCTFITTLNSEPIGVGSFDPRGAPQVGQIGINCILPTYRGRGVWQTADRRTPSANENIRHS